MIENIIILSLFIVYYIIIAWGGQFYFYKHKFKSSKSKNMFQKFMQINFGVSVIGIIWALFFKLIPGFF